MSGFSTADARPSSGIDRIRAALVPSLSTVLLRDEAGKPLLYGNGEQRRAHLYQFRHTFVKQPLESGAGLERIAEPLGNTYKIVEKHYSAWVRDRQRLLDETVQASWDKKELAEHV
jgi:hypothetical protein